MTLATACIGMNGKVLLLAIGRVMVDVWARAAFDAPQRGEWIIDTARIAVDVGGPTHVCTAFLESGGWSVHFVSAVGASRSHGRLVPDELGTFALQRLNRSGIPHSCIVVDGTQTGRVMIIYPPSGGRLMVADNATAPTVPASHIEAAIRNAVNSSDACTIYVDGYNFFDQHDQSVLEALASRPRRQTHLWLDVVPHTLYRDLSFGDFVKQIDDVDILTADRATILGFAHKQSCDLRDIVSAVIDDGKVLAMIDDGKVVVVSRTGEEALGSVACDGSIIDGTPGLHDRMVATQMSSWLRQKMLSLPNDRKEKRHGQHLP